MRWSFSFGVAAIALLACQSAPAPGASCVRSADCAAPLACHFGRCRSGCAADRDCPSGASCLLDADGSGSCALDTDLGCESGVGRECASGLVCVADRCAQICGAGTGCATGSICTPTGTGVSFCVPSGTDAAVPNDASLDGGSPTDATVGAGVGTACIGENFVCATLASTGQPYCWGEGASYALGFEPGATGSACAAAHADSDHALAVPIADVDQLACGRSWVCAHRRTDGAVLCWGDSFHGQLVLGGTDTCDRVPRRIDGVGFSSGHGQLTATTQLACALDATASTLRCWGGDQGTVNPLDPPIVDVIVRLPALTTVRDSILGPTAEASLVALSDGMSNSNESYGGGCYVRGTDGSVWCWGTTTLGQAGSPIGSTALTTSRQVMGLPSIRALAHSDAAACALDDGGALWCWGIDEHGDLAHPSASLASCPADATSYACSSTPLRYDGMTFGTLGADASALVFCAVASGGAGVTPGDVFCWGTGQFATNGRTDSHYVDDPRNGHILRSDDLPIAGATQVVSGWSNACAIDGQGALWCWGSNDHSQLQQPTTMTQSARALRMQIP